ncbi:MAG TPA: OadG family protein [Marinagarivorans sp.]
MQQTIMSQGLDLMIFGMGTVFVFLTLLVFLTRAMSWFVNRYLPEPEPVIPSVPKPADSSRVDPVVIAVIQKAIHQHRKKQAQ